MATRRRFLQMLAALPLASIFPASAKKASRQIPTPEEWQAIKERGWAGGGEYIGNVTYIRYQNVSGWKYA
jgi:hypothetical protein